MFIKPDELTSLLWQNRMECQEHRGMGPNVSLLVFLRYLRKRVRGELTYKNLGEKLFLVESSNMSIMYMGYAIKSQ